MFKNDKKILLRYVYDGFDAYDGKGNFAGKDVRCPKVWGYFDVMRSDIISEIVKF